MGLASYHNDYWAWLWGIEKGVSPRPFVGIWPRAGGKSTCAEDGVIQVGARKLRNYVLYVSGTQPQADKHVISIGLRLEGEAVRHYYPDMANRSVNQYGSSRGWRRQQLWTRQGFIVDALGLDTTIRGVKLGTARPDMIILDDIDAADDSPETIQSKIHTLTHDILPTGSNDCAVLAIQNLVSRNGIVAQLIDGRADFLADRILSGPHLAIEGLQTETIDGETRIIAGTPTWDVMGIPQCQDILNRVGRTAFLAEYQHDVALLGTPRFNVENLRFMLSRCTDSLPVALLPDMFRSIEGLRVYQLPRPGIAYVQYIDPAEGKGRDYTATGIMEARTRDVVCLLEDNTREPTAHASIACDLWEWYNKPFLGYERAKGEAIALVLGQRGVDRIYQHVDNPLTPQQRARGIQEKRIPGFPMTAHSKRGLIDRLGELIESLGSGTPDKRMVQQAESYLVTEGNRLEAAAGGHDDLVIVWAGLVLLSEQPGAQGRGTIRAGSGSYSYVAPRGRQETYRYGR